VLCPTPCCWIVSGTNGENRIEARGASQGEAWHNAMLQAKVVRMARLSLFGSLL
jgi:hypothetical protein